MILGIGTDIVDIRRVERLLLAHPHVAIARLMSPAEQRFYRNDICLGFAKIWAYKEAVIKASSGRLLFRDIEIEHDSNGAPRVSVADGRSAFMSHCGPPALSQVTWHLTLSDELPYIFAVCIAECNSD